MCPGRSLAAQFGTSFVPPPRLEGDPRGETYFTDGRRNAVCPSCGAEFSIAVVVNCVKAGKP